MRLDMNFSGSRTVVTEARKRFVFFGDWIVDATGYDAESNCIAMWVGAASDLEAVRARAKAALYRQMDNPMGDYDDCGDPTTRSKTND